MLMKRRTGFTLIELLVVIAIIAILAAMLFPVFARARESARKIQCLSNVKNIATAVQMYLTDYDRFPPFEHRAEVLAWFDSMPGGNSKWNGNKDNHCGVIWQANPYLRWPVIFDEYVKNRDVWRCPSAKMETGAEWIYPYSDWFSYAQKTVGTWKHTWWGPCQSSFPSGWGGTITDSALQDSLAAGADAFVESIGVEGSSLAGMNTSQINDPSHAVVAGDAGPWQESIPIGALAYPDICQSECGNSVCTSVDWINCSSSCANNGIYNYAPKDGTFYTNPVLQAKYTRHLGGSNVGFADGHASWFLAHALLADYKDGNIEDVGTWGPHSNFDGCTFTTQYPGVPVLF
jgi:prepilin-type N-terminal cleavage/methylation domain-containing protein/prepilin-type processing-associated H-X9-DG protein